MEFWAEWIVYLAWPIIGVCYLLYRWGRRFFYWCGLAHKWHQARLYISAKIIYFLIHQLCLRVDAVDDRKVVVKVKVIAGVEFDIGGPVAILHEAAKDLVRLCRGLDSDEEWQRWKASRRFERG